MKKKARIVGRTIGNLAVMICPFCGYRDTQNRTMPWCVGCRVEYRELTSEAIQYDTKLKTGRFAWAKAFNAAGGMRIGSVQEVTRNDGY